MSEKYGRTTWTPSWKSSVDIVDDYPYIAMDTEFPGVVARPVGNFKNSGEYHYQTLRQDPQHANHTLPKSCPAYTGASHPASPNHVLLAQVQCGHVEANPARTHILGC